MTQTNFEIKPAMNSTSYLRMMIAGVSKAGKTYTALEILRHHCKKVAVIDTEDGTSRLLANKFPGFTYDVMDLYDFSREAFEKAFEIIKVQGYDGLVIDSLSHEWQGESGILDYQDKLAAELSIPNAPFRSWKGAKKEHERILSFIKRLPMHIIATIRMEQKTALEPDDKGKMIVKRLGDKLIQRKEIEYNFDIEAYMDLQHFCTFASRCSELDELGIIHKPGKEVSDIIFTWLSHGKKPEPVISKAEEPVAEPVEAPKPKKKEEPNPKPIDIMDVTITKERADALYQFARQHGWSPTTYKTLLTMLNYVDAEGNPSTLLVPLKDEAKFERYLTHHGNVAGIVAGEIEKASQLTENGLS